MSQKDDLISRQPDIDGRRFEEIVVEYPHPDVCTYPEFRGKPYFSIKYTENGEHFVGYGTYKPEVLSSYLKEYFMPSAQPELARINDCNGCKFIGCYDTDFPCANCVRKDKDYYEPEG